MADYNGFKKIDIYSSHTCLHPNPLSHCIIYIWRYQLWPHMLFASCDYIFRYHLWLHDGCYLNELMGYASWFNHQNGKGEKIGSESEIGIFKMNNRKNRIRKQIHIGLTLQSINPHHSLTGSTGFLITLSMWRYLAVRCWQLLLCMLRQSESVS